MYPGQLPLSVPGCTHPSRRDQAVSRAEELLSEDEVTLVIYACTDLECIKAGHPSHPSSEVINAVAPTEDEQ
jgi:hypothetical protein